ncbi:hypothetical protein [Hyphomonas sp.]|uniref:hypothetical protein n=1 Tax=Hyphomonas sp. TaxID=87 RepID=UPI002627C9AB|nr:hypothetical protein [Hyphomonas sp.]MDF1805261.1 hypothetical protein [Hyphomonas sp.]
MKDDLIIRIFRAYEEFQSTKKALLDELERKLHPFLEVLGAIIMLTPLLWIFSLLFGASE